MAKSIPNTPNLTVGYKINGWEIVEVIDAAAGSYVCVPAVVDAAAPYNPNVDYVGVDNEQFSIKMPATVINGPFVTSDGATLKAGKRYNLKYVADRTAAASISAIADDAGTKAEIELMELVGEVSQAPIAGSATVQTGSHAFGTTGTGTSASFAVTFPTPFINTPIVELTYRWNYNASTNGAALNPVVIIDGAPSTTGFNYRIIGGRNALDSVSWTAVDSQTSVQAGNQVLTPRDITGSITSKGFDGVTIPHQIPLTAGQVLDTVALNGAPTTDFDANTGIVRITPSGAAIAVTHTTKAGATFSALQWVGEFTPPDNTVYDTLATINTGINFTKCDYIEWQFRLTSDLRAISGWAPKIVGGATPTMEVCHGQGQISSYLANAADAVAGKLTNVDCHGVAFEVIKIRGWALGLNKVVVPSASTVLTPRKITGSITSDGYDGVDLPYQIPLAAGLILDTVSLNGAATTNFDANTGIVRIKPTGDVAVTHTTRAGATFTSLQMVGETNHNNTALTTAGVTFTLAATLQAGDLLEVYENYNNNTTEDHIHWAKAGAGRTFTMYQYPATGNSCTVVFPATLSNQVTIKGATNQYIKTIRIWRNSANGFVVPTATTLFTPRNITGTGIAASTVGRDNTVTNVAVTGIPAGSEISNPTATGGAIVLLRDSGRGGIAYLDVIPNGATTNITWTETVWRRTLTANLNGSAVNVNGAASINVDATRSVAFWLALPANHNLTAAPTVTGGALLSWDGSGSGVIQPDNSGNLTITANSAQAGAKSTYVIANSGTWVDFGTIGVRVPASGNRSLQVHSASGTISINYITWLGWDSTRAPTAGLSINTASINYLEGTWNFGNTGNSQQAIIRDVTNNRRFKVTMMINTGYNNIHYIIDEIT